MKHIVMTTKYRIPFFCVTMFRDVVIKAINHFSEKYDIAIYGWVINNAEVHLITQNTERSKDFVNNIKRYSGGEIARILGDHGRVWSAYTDNPAKQEGDTITEFSDDLLQDYLKTIHELPVNQATCLKPEDYPLSSARFYLYQEPSIIKMV